MPAMGIGWTDTRNAPRRCCKASTLTVVLIDIFDCIPGQQQCRGQLLEGGDVHGCLLRGTRDACRCTHEAHNSTPKTDEATNPRHGAQAGAQGVHRAQSVGNKHTR